VDGGIRLTGRLRKSAGFQKDTVAAANVGARGLFYSGRRIAWFPVLKGGQIVGDGQAEDVPDLSTPASLVMGTSS
jgi:hypothetical protein